MPARRTNLVEHNVLCAPENIHGIVLDIAPSWREVVLPAYADNADWYCTMRGRSTWRCNTRETLGLGLVQYHGRARGAVQLPEGAVRCLGTVPGHSAWHSTHAMSSSAGTLKLKTCKHVGGLRKRALRRG